MKKWYTKFEIEIIIFLLLLISFFVVYDHMRIEYAISMLENTEFVESNETLEIKTIK